MKSKIINLAAIAFLSLGINSLNAQQPKVVKGDGFSEEIAIEYLNKSLRETAKNFTPQNMRESLRITEEVGGFDNEAVIQPWFKFCEKHATKIFNALVGVKNPLPHAERLYMLSTYMIDNGLEYGSLSEKKEFEKKSKELGFLIEKIKKPKEKKTNPKSDPTKPNPPDKQTGFEWGSPK